MTKNKEKAHSKMSASGSAKWLNCPGSIKAEEAFAKTSNPAAEEGTLAHELADQCLKNNQDAIEYVDRIISCESDGKVLTKLVDMEMANFVQEYLDYVRSFEGQDTQLFTEDKVDFSNIVDDGFGTMDSAILNYKTRTCDIFDLKYGIRNKVEADENTQGQLYAVGLYNELKCLDVIDKFVIHIVQPRMYNFSSWEISVEDLEKFAKYAQKQAKLVLNDNAERIPGDKQCQWCEARHTCSALDKFAEQTIGAEFENLDSDIMVQDILNSETIDGIITNERIKIILDNTTLIKKFLESIQKFAFSKIAKGEKIPGYKIIQGSSNRKWADNAEAELKKILGPKAYELPSLIGITAAGKLMKKDEVNKLTYKPLGQLKMVKESEKGDPVKVTSADDFESLDNFNGDDSDYL